MSVTYWDLLTVVYTCACMNKVYMHKCTNLNSSCIDEINYNNYYSYTSLSPDSFPRSTHVCALSTRHFRQCSSPTAFIPLISRVTLSGASILGEPPIAIPLIQGVKIEIGLIFMQDLDCRFWTVVHHTPSISVVFSYLLE